MVISIVLAAPLLGNAAFAAIARTTLVPPSREVRLTAHQMLAAGRTFEQAGKREEAISLYQALAGDPDIEVRAEARFRHALLLQLSGDRSGAASLLRRVLDEKPQAGAVRIMLARLLDEMGDEPAARRALRAAQASGLPADLARFVDRYSAALRSNKPFGASIDLALAPDNNINRATRSDTLDTVIGPFVLDGNAKPRSGTGLALRGQMFGRVPIGDQLRLVSRMSASADLYKRRQYRDLAIELTAGPEFGLGRTRVSLEAAVGRRSYGGAPLLNQTRLGATAVHPIGRLGQARISASRAWLDHRLNNLQDGTATQLQMSVERALSSSTGLVLSLGGQRDKLGDAAYSTRSWRVGLLGWREIGRATLTAGFDAGRLRADDRFSLLPDARSDRSTRLTAGMIMRRWSVAGFAPTIRVTRERNRSTVIFYDYRRTRTEFGINRAF